MDGFLTRGSGLAGLSGVRDRDIVIVVQIFNTGFRGRKFLAPVDGWVRPILNILA